MVRRTRYVVKLLNASQYRNALYGLYGLAAFLLVINLTPLACADDTDNASTAPVVDRSASQDVELRPANEPDQPPPPPDDDRRGRRRPRTPEDEERWKLFRRWREAYDKDPKRVKAMIDGFFGEDRLKWLKDHAPELYEACQEQFEQEKKWYALLEEYHKIEDQAKRDELIPQIKKETEAMFDLQMKRQALDIEMLRKRCDFMERVLNERQAKRNEQIEEMVQRGLDDLPPPPREGGFPPPFGGPPPREKEGNPPPQPDGDKPPR